MHIIERIFDHIFSPPLSPSSHRPCARVDTHSAAHTQKNCPRMPLLFGPAAGRGAARGGARARIPPAVIPRALCAGPRARERQEAAVLAQQRAALARGAPACAQRHPGPCRRASRAPRRPGGRRAGASRSPRYIRGPWYRARALVANARSVKASRSSAEIGGGSSKTAHAHKAPHNGPGARRARSRPRARGSKAAPAP